MVVPSRDEIVMRETFSQVTVQGMLTGLPVLASNLPILTEKFDEGGGSIFQTSKDLTHLMRDCIEHPERLTAIGATGRRVALERYVWDTATFVNTTLFSGAAT